MKKSSCSGFLRSFFFGIACFILGACAESGTKRTKLKTQSNNQNVGESPQGQNQGTDKGKNANASPEGNFAGLSLAEQCEAKGEDFVYSDSEESCFKIIEKKTSEELCQSVDKEYLEDNGSCATVSKKQKLADLCSEKGATYQYNSTDDVCYEVSASSTIDELCTAAGEMVEFDSELMLCRVFSSVEDLEKLCTEVTGTVAGTNCLIGQDTKTLEQLCEDKGIGFFLYPSIEEPLTCNSVSQLIPANGICLAQGEATHVYKKDAGTCETVNSA